MSDLSSTVRHNLAWMSLRVALGAVFGLAATTLIVRNLSVEEYGLYNLLFALLSYIGLVSSFGVNETLQRYIPELFQKKDYYHLNRLVMKGLSLQFLAVTAAVGLVFVFADPIGRLLKIDDWARSFAAFSPYYLCMLEATLLVIILSSVFLQKYVALTEIGVSFARLSVIAIVLVAGYSLRGVILAEVLAAAAYALLLALVYFGKFLRAHAGTKTEPLFSRRRLVRYGSMSFLNDIGTSVLDVTTDYLIISSYLGPAAVALYAFPNRVVRMTTRFLPDRIFRMLIRPVFFVKYAEGRDKGELDRMFNLLLKVNAFLMLPVCAGLFALGDKIIVHLFDPKYLDSLVILWVVAAFVALNTCLNVVGLVLKAVERVEVLLKSKLFSLYNLAGDILVIPAFGILGVALVTGSAILFKNLYCYVHARRYGGISIHWRGLTVVLVNSSLTALVFFLCRPLVTNLTTLAAVTVAGAAFYAVLSRLNRPFSAEENATVNKVLPKPVFPF